MVNTWPFRDNDTNKKDEFVGVKFKQKMIAGVGVNRCMAVLLLVCVFYLATQSHHAKGKISFQPPRLNTGQNLEKCALVSMRYNSSKLETQWLEHAAGWAQDYCQHQAQFEHDVEVWIAAVSDLTNSSTAYALDKDVFSTFTHTYTCGSRSIEYVTYIEPLSHGLRHPNALCGRGADIVDRGYLLMSFQSDLQKHVGMSDALCFNRSCQAIYIDLGASTWDSGLGGPSQSWFVDTYRSHGIEFDRFLLWEAALHSPANVFDKVPANILHKYQYYNIPANADPLSPASPLNMISTIAQRGDFVLFKLDIDNGDVENKIVAALLQSPKILSLIDEFVFEHHVNFPPMLPSWGNTVDKNASLADSYNLFLRLRQMGIRAHSWV